MAFNIISALKNTGAYRAGVDAAKKRNIPVPTTTATPASFGKKNTGTSTQSLGLRTPAAVPNSSFGVKATPTHVANYDASTSPYVNTAQSGTRALAGTPTTNPNTPTYSAAMSSGDQQNTDARAYLQAENATSQQMGSKNLVSALRGEKSPTVSSESTTQATQATQPKLSAPVSRGTSVIDALRKRVSSLSAPSSQEAALNDELAQFRGDAAAGIAGREGQGRGIPLSLVRGEQAKLQQQAGIQEQTLLDRIAAASAQRQAQLQAAQSDYSMASDEQQRQEAIREYEQNRQDTLSNQGNDTQLKLLDAGYTPTSYRELALINDPEADVVTINGQPYLNTIRKQQNLETLSAGQTLYDPNTGQALYTAPDSVSGGGFSLSPGQTRYDAYGNAIASAPSASEASGGLSSLSSTQQNAVADYNSTLDAIEQAKAMINAGGFVTGPLASFTQGLGGKLGLGQNQARIAADAALTTIKANYQKALSGQGVSDNEVARLTAALPGLNDPPETIITKLDQLSSQIGRQKDSLLSVAGATQASTDANDDPLGLGFSGAGSTALNSSIVNVPLGNSSIQVSSEIAQPLAMADAEYFRATGKHIQISEGVRSRERQAMLYQRYKSGQGGRAAPPGQSFHETGKAIDVSGDWKAAEPYLRKYGFLNNLADDKHHFSIGEFT